MEVELKQFQPQDLDLKDDGSFVVAFAKLGAVDSDEDYTFHGAFKSGQAVPVSDYGHAIWPTKGAKPPTGRAVLSEDGEWALATGSFLMKTTQGQNAYETVKGMSDLQQWSYGYNVLEKAAPPAGIKARRGLAKLDVKEISPVFLGAQALAHTRAIKELDELDEFDQIMETLKDSSLAGLTYAEMSQRVLRGLEAFTTRTLDINEMRVKEGRALSTARQTLLEEAIGQLADYTAKLRAMVDAAQPKAPVTEPQKQANLVLEAAARFAALRSAALTEGLNA